MTARPFLGGSAQQGVEQDLGRKMDLLVLAPLDVGPGGDLLQDGIDVLA